MKKTSIAFLAFVIAATTHLLPNDLAASVPRDSVPDCDCKQNRHSNKEGARWTAIPHFSPLIPIRHQVRDGFARLNTNTESSWAATLRLFYYAPNTNGNWGVDLSYLDRSISIKDPLAPTFYTQEVEINPFVGFKTGDFSKTRHFAFDVGIAYAYATARASRRRTALGGTSTQVEAKILKPHKFHFTGSMGVYLDIFRSGWKRVGVFSAAVKYHLPFQGSYFKAANLPPSNPSSEYANLSSTWDYLTFTAGAVIDIKGNKWGEGYGSHERDSLRPWASKLRLPVTFSRPGNEKVFGGFNAAILYMTNLDSSRFASPAPSDSLISFRPKNNFSLGYNIHFLSLHRLKMWFSFDCFAGVDVQFKQFLADNASGTNYYRLVQPGGVFGARVGAKDFFLVGGGRAGYSWIKEKEGMSTATKTPVEFSKKWLINYFVGIGYRNFLSIQVESEPLLKAPGRTWVEKGPYYLKIGIGF